MDTPIYIDTYFRVESGYDGGRMPEEKAGRFFDEVKRLFTETGFSIKETNTKTVVPRCISERHACTVIPNRYRALFLKSTWSLSRRFWHKERPSGTYVLTLTARFST